MTEPPAERDGQAISRFRERYSSVLAEAGVPVMPARVFAALAVTDSGALTAADLGALLSASPAAISGAVRYLEQIGMIRREREPGSRRDVYHADSDWYEMTFQREQLLARWAGAARDGVGVLGPQTPAGRRMADTLSFFEFIQAEMSGVTDRWRKYRSQRASADGGDSGG